MSAMSAGGCTKQGRCWRLLVSALLWSAIGAQAGRLPRELREEKLIGWSESYKSPEGNSTISNPLRNSWVETLSWEPRVFLYHSFLTPGECEHLILKGKEKHMEKSSVVDNQTGKSIASKIRTSSGAFLKRGQDDPIQQIETKIAKFTGIPAENGEGLQILNYEASEKYEAHFDYFHDQTNQMDGGQRLATMLMYLSDVEEGGETVFPASTKKPKAMPGVSDCARRGAFVRPRKGDAVLFYSLKPNGDTDEKSLHGGCPVIRGSKWSATKWMRIRKYRSG
ncbi:hypothetical protein WJX74_010472 [Apatococcus lobatus]|uniref:procollagen-proline 4-dioxygenase n=1 Tax=Apatococcus lobatus TaxID=904363 RepID=A0AAW1SGP6_9CHLO